MKFSFVCFSQNNWEKRKARKQQFMLALAKRGDVDAVVYIEPPLNFWRLIVYPFSELGSAENRQRWQRALRFHMRQAAEKLYVYTPVFFIPFGFRCQQVYTLNLIYTVPVIQHQAKKIGIDTPVVWLYHPFDAPVLRLWKKRIMSVFDWAEEWGVYFTELSDSRRREVRRLEETMIAGVDVVFTVSQELQRQAQKNNSATQRLWDGTDADMFRAGDQQPVPEDMKNISSPIIGYAGTVTERFDVKVVEALARCFRSAAIVIVGSVHQARADVSCLRTYPNVHFLGVKEYSQLGAYVSKFDVCIIPYAPIPSTYIFPTKIFDYFAAGKPVVTTPLFDMQKFSDAVYIADTAQGFVEAVAAALQETDSLRRQKRLHMASTNSWSARAQDIMDAIQKAVVCKK